VALNLSGVPTPLAAAIGNAAGQVTGNVIGTQDGFSFKSVALAALSAQFTPQPKAGEFFSNVGNAALANAGVQGIAVVTGLQSKFNFRAVAAAGLSAGIGQSVGESLTKSNSALAELVNSGGQFARDLTKGFASSAATSIVRDGKVSVKQISADAFGNLLGNALGTELSSKPRASVFEIGNNTESAFGKRSFGRLAPIDYSLSSNGVPRLPSFGGDTAAFQVGSTASDESISTNGGPIGEDISGNLPTRPNIRFIIGGPAVAGAGRAERQPRFSDAAFTAAQERRLSAPRPLQSPIEVQSLNNAYAFGITDEQVNADIQAGNTGVLSAASFAARKTAYSVFNFVTVGFVERQDERLQDVANGRLSEDNLYKAAAIDGVASVASLLVGGRAGGFVAGRVSQGYVGFAATGATAAGAFDLTQQVGDNAIFAATDGQNGRAGFDVDQFGNSVVFGAGLGLGGRYLSEYGNYNIHLRSQKPGTLYSNPLPFELVSQEGTALSATTGRTAFIDFNKVDTVAPGFYRANPLQLRFSQSDASPSFSKGGTIDSLVADLRSGKILPEQVGNPLQVVIYKGKPFSIDNRRLLGFSQAGVISTPIQVVSLSDPIVANRFFKRFDPIGGEGFNIVIAPAAERTAAQKLLKNTGLIKGVQLGR
jgi:hypothetical protein